MTIPSLVGWLFGVSWLVQPLATFVPARLGGILMILAGSFGLIVKLSGHRTAAQLLAGVSGSVAAVALLSTSIGLRLPFDAIARARVGDTMPSRDISVSAAILFLVYGVALYLLASSESPATSERRRTASGALAAIMVAMSGVLLLAQLADLLGQDGAIASARAPLHTLLAALLLGLALLQRNAAYDRSTSAPPRWAPVLAGAATSLVVLVLWQALAARESAQLRARGAIAADALGLAVTRQFVAVDRAVGRSAVYLASSAGPDDQVWETTFPRLIDETDGLAAILMIDSNGVPLRAVPSRLMSAGLPKALSTYLASSRGNRASSTRDIVDLAGVPWGLALIYPITTSDWTRLRVVGLVDEKSLVRSFSENLNGGFSLAVMHGDSIITGQRSASSVTFSKQLPFGSRVLTITASQREGVSRTTLPELVLLLGLCVAALLTLTLWQQRTLWKQASSEGRERMQRAIERSTDGVWELDVQQGRTHRSPAILRYLGIDPLVLEGGFASWSALMHPDDGTKFMEALNAHLNGETEAFECEYRIRAGDGAWHMLVDRGRVVERTSDGHPARLLGISADVTERARAEAAREASERRFRAMFDTANQLQLLLDLDGRVLEANRAAGELAGIHADALQGRRFWEVPWWQSDATTSERVEERFVKARAGEPNQFEVEILAQNKRPANVDFSLKPIRDSDDQVIQVLAEGRDLTVRKRAEESLREIGALTTMGQLAARVAHEINNPLAGIQTSFLLIRGAIPTDHPHYRFVGAIEREIGRIAAVTRQLYETYRPDQLMVAESSVILAVTDAVSFLEQVNRMRQVKIVTDLTKAPSLVPVPDALLRQTLYNLVQNAFDASPANGTISVTAAVELDHCVIRVSDEGPGVPAALQERIFDPFFSTKDRTVKTGGMGIGLSLVRQSVQAVGGTIAVHNRSGGGTEFEVRLPMTPLDTGVLR